MAPCKGVDATAATRTRMIQQLVADTPDDPLEVTTYFRHLVTCITDPPLETMAEEIVGAGCLPKFVNFLQRDRLDLQKQAAWVLGNIAVSVRDHVQAVAAAGAVAPLVSLLNSDDLSTKGIVTRSLANIASVDDCRDHILDHDVFTPLLPSITRNENLPAVSALFRNLCMGRNPPVRLSLVRPGVPTLARLVSHSDPEVSDNSCRALVSLLRTYKERLSPSLDASFYDEFHNIHKMNPDRSEYNLFASELKQTSLIPSFPSQHQATPQCNSTPTSPRNSTLTSPRNSTLTSPRTSASPSPRAASRTLSRRRPRSASPQGMSTRNTPKRPKTSSFATVCISPTKPRTRACSKRFINKAPNHSASYISLKKDELFRAVEEGKLECVEQLVRHTGPSVTKGKRECTLLHLAAENNQPHMVQFLLQFISPNVVNHDGNTPAHLAAMRGHTQVLHMLLSDPLMIPDKRDLAGNTYAHWLVGHLLEAVLKEDIVRVRSLLSVGADVDQQVGGTAGGVLARELQITSVRHLASVLHNESILRMFDAKHQTMKSLKAENGTATQNSISFAQQMSGSPVLRNGTSPVVMRGPDVYRMDATPRGYVCILSYDSFQERPDLRLEGSQTDAHNLANVFSKMGYAGHAHFSLTADQTRQQLAKVRDMELLERAGCAVFIISSHGEPQRHFLTSDMHTINTQWVLDFFKESQCPHLKNKPKLFIWNLCRGHQEEETGRGKPQAELCGRVDEPLRDVTCLDSSSGGFTWHSFSEQGTPFIRALCNTLAHHAPAKELTEVYREFLKEYATAAPDAVPQLTNYGFSKRFYFT